jgi:two-component system nitrate/nitrite response regulator NarL
MKLLLLIRGSFVRRALVALVADARSSWSCDAAVDQDDAERCLAKDSFDLIICGLDALEAPAAAWISRTRAMHPLPRIVVLAPDVDRYPPLPLLEAGVHGYLDEIAPLDQILIGVLDSILGGSVHLVISGEYARATRAPVIMSPPVSPAAVHLTPRQQAVMQHLSCGRSVKEIARHLDLSIGTVKTHLSNMYSVLGARNRVEAIARAGVITSPLRRAV